MSIVEMWSRYLTYVSFHPIVTWDARFVSSLCHRLRKKEWSPRLLAPLFTSTAFAWSVIGYVRVSLVTELLLYDSTELSTLQMLLWFGPSYLDRVEARRHTDACSIPVVRVSGTKDIEQSPRICLSSINSRLPISKMARLDSSLHPSRHLWDPSVAYTTLFDSSLKIILPFLFKSLRKDFCAWSNSQLFQLFVDFFHLFFVL